MADDNIIEIEFKGKGDLLQQIKKLDKATKSLLNTQARLVKQGKLIKSNANANTKALETIKVKLQAVNLDYKAVGISTKLWNSALSGSRVSLEKVKNAIKKFNQEQRKTITVNKKVVKSQKQVATGQKKQIDSTRILGGSFAVLRSKLLIYNFAMGLGIRQTLKFVNTAGKLNSLSTAFNTLTNSTEDTFTNLNKLQRATNNTVSDTDLLTQANNALVLGVTDSVDEMAKMFDMAQRLGKALGRDTATSVESLITGIGRQSRLMLDNIGIIVKSEEAYEAYAKANNKLAKNLTDSEKKQAFFNATMESAEKKIESLGDETLNAQDTFDQFTANASNLSVAFGQALIPHVEQLTKGINTLSKSAINFFKGLTETSLQTTIRELRELGVEGEALKNLEEINLQQEIIALNNELKKINVDSVGEVFFSIDKVQEELNKKAKSGIKLINSRVSLEENILTKSKTQEQLQEDIH